MPKRRVALKLMKPGLASRPALSRFAHESQVLGRLSHPGIARIIEAGMYDAGSGPQPFFAMEFIEGRPLNTYADSHNLSVTDRLHLMIKVCDAVLVYWGRGDALWQRAKLRDLVRVRGLGRATPFLTQAVWVAGPPTEEKAGFATGEATVVSDLGSFLELLRNPRKAGA